MSTSLMRYNRYPYFSPFGELELYRPTVPLEPLKGDDLKVYEELQTVRHALTEHGQASSSLAQGVVQALLANPEQRIAQFACQTDASVGEPRFFFDRRTQVSVRTQGWISLGDREG